MEPTQSAEQSGARVEADDFHDVLDRVLGDPSRARVMAEQGRELAREKYDTRVLARQVRALYEELVDEKSWHSRRKEPAAQLCAT